MRWQPLIDHFNKHLTRRLELIVLNYTELDAAIRDRKVDIVLSQPAHYTVLMHREGLYMPLATLLEREAGHVLDSFGGVILVRAERQDIKHLADLRGKRIAISSQASLGSYQAPALELQDIGIDMPDDVTLVESNGMQDTVVENFLAGKADAAFIRTAVYESLIREGKIDAAAFRIIKAANIPDYPLALSTRLYPQWALAAMPWADRDFARQVAAAALSLPGDSQAAKASRIAGFTVPGNYQRVERMMQSLRVPPFDKAEFVFADVWARYHWPIKAVVIALLLLIVQTGRLAHGRRALRLSEARAHGYLDNAPTAMFVADSTGRYVDANPAASALTGYNRGELLHGITIADLARTADMTAYVALFDKVKQKGEGSFDLPLKRKDGAVITVALRAAALPSGEVIGFATDVTLQRATQQAQSALTTTMTQETGNALYMAVSRHLAEALDLDFAFVGHLNGARTGVDVAAGWAMGAAMTPFSYDLAGTPCADVMKHGHAIYTCGIQALYPKDELLQQMGIESYAGSTLFDNHGKPMGILVGLARHAITNPELADKLFDVFVESVSAEMMRMDAERALQQAASVFEFSHEGIMITATDGRITDVNEAFCRITGYRRDEVLGQNPRILKSGRHDAEFYKAMWDGLQRQGHWSSEVWNRRKNGEIYAQMQTISAVRDGNGSVLRYVCLFSDITALKEHQHQLERIAHYDALTNLPNRVLLADRLRQGMAQVQRHGTLLAVVYLDLDGFKAVNDTHSHETGDKLLTLLSGRMKEALREIDTLSRLGGDEFVAVLVDLQSHESSAPVIERLLAAAAEPVHIDGLELYVSASIGVSFFPQSDEVDADQLLRQADQAMYQAKQAGKNRFHIFDIEHDRSVRGHHESLDRISLALSQHEFVLHYQPKVNMRSGEIIGAEALIRWQHPERGLLSPAAFLPVIENHPLIIGVGDWVLETALTRIEAWRSQGLNLPVSVNIDAMQFDQPDFMDKLRALLARHPAIRPGDLELEVLETSALEDIIQISETILACQSLGVGFALDDFGTGYSSLTYLKRLPAQQLKIDQSFVRGMLDSPEDLAILEGVLGLANAFRRQAIAEGVETLAHGEMLLMMGCEFAQGYAIAKPMPATAIPAWVSVWRPADDWSNQAPVDRSDLPVIFAMVEHRAWVQAFSYYLHGELDTHPPLDCHHCRFGQWLDKTGIERHAGNPVFQRILDLHESIHRQAGELVDLKQRGYNSLAESRSGEINDLRDKLLAEIKLLLN